jgi:hypothetical protein
MAAKVTDSLHNRDNLLKHGSNPLDLHGVFDRY